MDYIVPAIDYIIPIICFSAGWILGLTTYWILSKLETTEDHIMPRNGTPKYSELKSLRDKK